MLTKVGGINELPEDFFKDIPALEQGQTVKLKTLHFNDVQDAGTKVMTRIWEKRAIPLKDIIVIEGKRYPIGIPSSVSANNKVEIFHSFDPSLETGLEKYTGEFYLTGGAVSRDGIPHEELYYFLKISNLNKDKENRNTALEPLFEFTDSTKEAKKTVKKNNDLMLALNAINGYTKGELVRFAASLGYDINDEQDVMLAKIQDFAMKDIVSFSVHFTDPLKDVKAEISIASQKGVIAFDGTSTISFIDGNVLIYKINNTDGDWIKELATYCVDGGGDKVFETIKKLNKAKKTA